MTKLYLSFLVMSLFATSLIQAQNKCGFAYTMEQARTKGFRDDAFEAEIARLIQHKLQQQGQGRLFFTGPVTLPVIFHVIHRGETEGAAGSQNLGQAIIQAQLNQLNADYANLSGSAYGVAANVQIQFCLAVIDPVGASLVQPGIDRINGVTQGWSNVNTGAAFDSPGEIITYFDGTIKPASIWDPNRYINIWTADMNASGLLGYASFPAFSTLPGLSNSETNLTAGVVIAAGSAGSVSTLGYAAPYNMGRTLTHELGHFFGLRHIWGDGDCTATDYCNDTPPQDQETAGCPAAGALNNCIPNVPKMFENYMDYSNDACLNTFTADQALRMQTVMDNSPRRLDLLTSSVCTPPVANAVAFLSTSTATTEAPTVLTCPRYKEVTVSLKAAVAASGNATVTFVRAGTATHVADYTITPASVDFTNGDNTTKVVTVRINDDATVESAETIILTYTISGSGVVASTVAQSHTVTITDNDVTPVIDNVGFLPLFTQDFETSVAGWSTGSFTGLGNNEWTVDVNGGTGITGNSAYITDDAFNGTLNYDATSASDVVLVSPLINMTSSANGVLTFKYKCNGEIDLGTYRDFGRILYSFNGTSFTTITDGGGIPIRFQGTTTATTATVNLPAALNNTSYYLGFRWTNNATVGNNPPFVIDDIVVSVPATRIESTVSQPVTENVFSSQDVYLKSSADGQLLARIQNASADIGCLTATLLQAGNTRVSILTNNGQPYFRTQKVIQISPTVLNSTVTYQGTIYFSTAELQAWIDAGVPVSTLKILKVTDGTNLGGLLNFSNAQVITPVFSDQSAFGYYAYTGNFTGFSQFMLVSPTTILPVELISFEAKAVRKSIVLNWSTSQELNNKGFAIERSSDGNNFEKIGWVDGKVTTNVRTDYQYTDIYVQPGVTYYYRLRQTDIDLREKLSMVRQARIDRSGVTLTINPNPATDQLNLFISGAAVPAEVSLINMQGQLIRKWSQVNASSQPYKLNISGVASGLYMLRVQLPDEMLVEKIIVR